MRLEVQPDAERAARRAAELLLTTADASRQVPGSEGAWHPLSLAVSGGSTPARMLRALAERELPWDDIAIFQVDERVAPAGHDARNLTLLLDALPPEAHASVRPMPVEQPDLEAAAARYAALLPERLDAVHLGLGADGHTASLVPGDAVLEVRDRLVAVTGEYEGRRRMTLTYPALEAARGIVWLVTGVDKREALRRLLDRDPSIPAGRIDNPAQIVVADAAARS